MLPLAPSPSASPTPSLTPHPHPTHLPRPPAASGPAHGPEPVGRRTAVLYESRHEFRFTIMVLSSELQGAKLRVRVSPTCPDLAANPNLCQDTRPFASMARMPDENELESRKRKAEAEAEDTTVWRSCGLVDGSDEDDEDASPQYVSLCGLSDGAPPAPAPDLKEEQEEEEVEAPRALTRTLTLTL